MTVTHKTDIEWFINEPEDHRSEEPENDYVAGPEGPLGRFCEMTGEIFDHPNGITITDCICKVRMATEISNKIIGIITKGPQMIEEKLEHGSFASHGDVLVIVDDGEYHLGDLLVPTLTGARVAKADEKLTIMLNGLPRVRVTSIDGNVLPKINDRACVACFIS
jgi:hypothetical protein